MSHTADWFAVGLSAVALAVSIFTYFRGEELSKRQVASNARELVYQGWDLIADQDGAPSLTKVNQSPYKREEAKRYFERAYVLANNDPEVLRRYGSYLWATAELDKSLELLRQAAKLTPSDARVFSDIGYVFLSKNDYNEAKHYYEQAIKLNPRNPYAHFGLGRVQMEQGDEQAALHEFQTAVDINPDFNAAQYHLDIVKQNTDLK